ncbi:MAG: hypothetical protein J6W64_07675 [Bacilli bacterium]|nr:hypothetical protein [Bacilli bacterium]
MSKYTMELRTIIDYEGRDTVENYFKDYCINNYLRPDEIESILSANIWSKDRLASKIVDHYYMREIGYETIGLFKHYAKVYMQEIMERYLPLIYSASIKYDPLVNVDYTESFERNIAGSGETQSSSSNQASGLSVNSDTPQGQISKQDILTGKYASNTGASETESSINDSSTNSNNTDETYTKRVKGNSGVSATAQKMVEQYRQNIIAIDEQIIKELDKLFMGLY